jgi:hypothetical protein
MDERWAAVDDYLSERLAPGEAALTAALAANAAAGLVAADVSAAQGRLLELLARGAGDPRDRDARRLQHDLAGAGAPARRAPGDARG